MKKIKVSLKNPIKIWKEWSKRKKIISSTIAVVLICAIIGCLIFVQNGQSEDTQMIVQEATVTMGNISNTIVGTGTLETDNSNTITVPSGITIKKVKVESGDAVSKGDTLATVDVASVLSAINTVQEEIESLDEELNDCKDSDETETITAKISGTVKKIYAKSKDSVTDCIAENGALLVLAVDGDSDEQLEITASGGTVSKIYVSKKEKVSAGDTLLTIIKDEKSTEYRQLLAQRKALAESLKKLSTMAKTGKIVAEIDGTVGDVNIADGSESASSSTSTSSSTDNSSSNKGVSASQMAYTTGSTTAQTLTATKSKAETTAQMSGTTRTSSAITLNTAETINESSYNSNEKFKLKVINSGNSTKSNLVISIPKTGNKPQSEIKVSDGSYEGKITWSPSDSTFAAGTTYGVDVTLTAKAGFYFGADSIISVQTGILSGTTVSDDGTTLTFHITFPATEEEQSLNTQEKTTNENNNSGQQQETSNNGKMTEGEKNSTPSENSNTIQNTFNNSNTGSTSQTGGTSSKTSSTLSSTQSTENTDNADSGASSYSNEVTIFTLATNDSMLLSVNVDELDINSVSKGQEANITLDAIEDKTFTGTVTKVSNSASSSTGGVAKYTVQVTVPKDNQMKIGMNASATIVIENKENVLTIPVNALQEKRGQSFVYTQKDEEGNLSGETAVTTGLSNGDSVEITEGLSEGDIVYYQRTGKISNQSLKGTSSDGHSGYGNRGDMSGGFTGQGGASGMPSGEMPAGGPGGNQ